MLHSHLYTPISQHAFNSPDHAVVAWSRCEPAQYNSITDENFPVQTVLEEIRCAERVPWMGKEVKESHTCPCSEEIAPNEFALEGGRERELDTGLPPLHTRV